MTTDFERFVRDAEGELSANRDTLNMYEKERRELEKRFRAENPRYQQVCDKCQQWRDEVSFAQRHLDRARKVAAGSTAKPLLSQEPMSSVTRMPSLDKSHPMQEPAPETEHLGAVQLGNELDLLPEPEPFVGRGMVHVSGPDRPEPEPEQREVVTEKPSLPFPHGPFQSLSPALAPVHAGFDRANAKRQVRGWRAAYPLAASYKNASRLERQALTAEITNHPDYDAWLDEGNDSVTDPHANRNLSVLLKAADDLGINHRLVTSKARTLHLDISNFGVQGVDYMWRDK